MNEPKDPKSETSSESDYAVGYGRPPHHSRFQPGQSGNPQGRPKGTKNLKTDLAEELSEKILVREGEQSQRISKQRAVVKTVVTKTLKGDARAASLLTSMMLRLLDTGVGVPELTAPLEDDESAILDAFKERIQRKNAGSERVANPEPGPGSEDAS